MIYYDKQGMRFGAPRSAKLHEEPERRHSLLVAVAASGGLCAIATFYWLAH